MEKGSKIRIGIIGCGGAGWRHARRLADIPSVQILGCMDTDAKRARDLADEISANRPYKPNTFTDYRKMIETLNLDAVGIYSPHTAHYEQGLFALKNGLHVQIEKPMVCSADHAKQLIKAAANRNRVLLVTYQRHYQPIYRYAKQIIEEGQIGEIQFLSSTMAQDWLQPQKGSWRQDPSLSGGGQLMDSGSHIVDIILWLTGLSASEVYAFTNNLGTKVDILSALSIRFNNNALGNISISGNGIGWFEEHLIWGSEGAIFIRDGNVYYQSKDGDVIKPGKLPPTSSADINFVEAILGKDQVHAPGICGLKVAQLTEAAFESAKIGQVIKIKC